MSKGYHVHTFINCEDSIDVYNHNKKTVVYKKTYE